MLDDWIPFGVTDGLIGDLPADEWDLWAGEGEALDMEPDWEAEEARLDRLAADVSDRYNALVRNHAFMAGETYDALVDRGLPRELLAPVQAGCQCLWTSLSVVYAHIQADRVDAAALDLCAAERDWQGLSAAIAEANEALARHADWAAEEARLDRLAADVSDRYNALVRNHAFTAGGTYDALADRGLPRDLLAPVQAGCKRLWTSLSVIYAHIQADRVEAAALDLRAAERDWQGLSAAIAEAGKALARQAAPPVPIECRA